MALSVAVKVVGKLTPKNGLGIMMQLWASRVEVTVIVENVVRGMVDGLRLTVRSAPPLDVIINGPTESM
jgi:hypothetical protein